MSSRDKVSLDEVAETESVAISEQDIQETEVLERGDEETLLNEEDYEESEESVGRSGGFLKTAAMSVFALYFLAGSTVGFVAWYESYLEEQSRAEIVEYAKSDDVTKVEMDMRLLQDELSNLGIENRLMQLQEQVDQLNTSISSVTTELDKFKTVDTQIASLNSSLGKLTSQVNNLDYARPVEIRRVSNKAFELQSAIEKINKELQSIKSPPSSERVSEEVTANKPVKKQYKQIHQIGPLKLEKIIKHADRYLMVMGDGISGSVQISEGNRIGRYMVQEVKEDVAFVKDMVGETVFELRALNEK
ncbi:hypothetical protein [Vibrio mediterranei]|uniref:hypothetical protein n=1 Tax=Vibrio mediterranei TaxID=689 RepID=UPI0040685551